MDTKQSDHSVVHHSVDKSGLLRKRVIWSDFSHPLNQEALHNLEHNI